MNLSIPVSRPDKPIELPYTICFCICGDKVLMLLRDNNPNKGLWNGIGGKIEPGETPLQSIHREINEEAGIFVEQATEFKFGGIVSWHWKEISGETFYKGMYTFIARFSEDVMFEGKKIDEGFLEWKTLDWVLNKDNLAVVPNIPHFLPALVTKPHPGEYLCHYEKDNFIKMTRHSLPPDFSII